MDEPVGGGQDAFIWNVSGGEVVLTQEGNAWRVICTGAGILSGPRLVIYSARYTEGRMAAWDFMGRVKRFGREEDGLQAGQGAATWIRQRRGPEQMTRLHD